MGTSKKGTVWTLPAGKVGSVQTKLWNALDDEPRGGDVVIRLDGDNAYRRRVVDFMLNGGFNPSMHQQLAKCILGDNFWGVEDWVRFYGLRFTKKQLRQVAEFPWDAELLTSQCDFHDDGRLVKDTHFAFLGIDAFNSDPLTVKQWLELHNDLFYQNNNPWHTKQPHTDKTTLTFKWHMLLKDIVPGSVSKTHDEQKEMLPDGYVVPSTIEEVTKDLLAFRKAGVRLNPSVWAACSEVTVETERVTGDYVGNRSCVGLMNEYGLLVNNWDGDGHDDVGCGASRES